MQNVGCCLCPSSHHCCPCPHGSLFLAPEAVACGGGGGCCCCCCCCSCGPYLRCWLSHGYLSLTRCVGVLHLPPALSHVPLLANGFSLVSLSAPPLVRAPFAIVVPHGGGGGPSSLLSLSLVAVCVVLPGVVIVIITPPPSFFGPVPDLPGHGWCSPCHIFPWPLLLLLLLSLLVLLPLFLSALVSFFLISQFLFSLASYGASLGLWGCCVGGGGGLVVITIFIVVVAAAVVLEGWMA